MVSEFTPSESGEYEWYIFSSNGNHEERFPIYGYKSFQVLDPVAYQPVLINELLARNVVTNTDEAGEYDDWIEILNDGDLQVDLANHYLTDKRDNLTKWKFPDSVSVISPNNYILIWCDEDQEQGDLHTNFKLSSGGEFIGLVHPDGVTVLDSITFPAQQQDISYGRVFNGGYNNQWEYLTPTPGLPNELLSLSNPISINSFEINKVYPNPFNSSFTISLNIDRKLMPIKIDIVSLTGRTIKSKTVYPSSLGQINIKMGLDNTSASGYYFLKVTKGAKMFSKKLLFLK